MQLGRIVGTLVASQKVEGLEGIRLLILQPLDRELAPEGAPLVAADATHAAAPEELVYFVSSREAALAFPGRFVPIDHAVVGIADAVEDSE